MSEETSDTALNAAIQLLQGSEGDNQDDVNEVEEDQEEEEKEESDVSEDEETEDDEPSDDEDESHEEDKDDDEESDDPKEENKDEELLYDVKVGDETKKVSLEELKSSYMRNADYTVKTQELARDRERTAAAKTAYEQEQGRYKAIIEEANKILPELVIRESDKLDKSLREVKVENLSDDQLKEYNRLRLYRDQLRAEEDAKDRQYKELVKKSDEAALEAARKQWALDEPEVERIIPDYKDPVKREALNSRLTQCLIDVYGQADARKIASSINSKNDYLMVYYASLGKKYLETSTPAKIEARKKEKVLKATNNAGRQGLPSTKGTKETEYNRIRNNARKHHRNLTEAEAVKLISMIG